MSKRVFLSKIRIVVYVKTCFFVENPEFWVCQSMFFYRKSGFVGMSKRVFLSKIRFFGYVKTCLLSKVRIFGYVKTCFFDPGMSKRIVCRKISVSS